MIGQKSEKNDYTDLLFYIPLVVYVVSVQISYTVYNSFIVANWGMICRLCYIPLIIHSLLSMRDHMVNYVEWSFFLFLFILFYIQKAQQTLFLLFLFAGRKMEFRKIASVQSLSTLAVLLLTFLFSQIGIIDNNVDIRGNYLIGYNQHNFPGCFFLSAFMLRTYFKQKNLSYIEIIIWFVSSVFLFLISGSRTTFVICLLSLVVILSIKIWPDYLNNKTVLQYIFIMAFIIFAILSVVLMIYYNGTVRWMSRINHLLTNRVELSHEAFLKYGILFFVSTSFYERFNSICVDNYYCNLILFNGVLIFVVILAAFTLRMIKASKDGDKYLLVLLMIGAILAFSEYYFAHIACNGFWFTMPHIFRKFDKELLISNRTKTIKE